MFNNSGSRGHCWGGLDFASESDGNLSASSDNLWVAVLGPVEIDPKTDWSSTFEVFGGSNEGFTALFSALDNHELDAFPLFGWADAVRILEDLVSPDDLTRSHAELCMTHSGGWEQEGGGSQVQLQKKQ